MTLIREDKILCDRKETLVEALMRSFSFVSTLESAQSFIDKKCLFINDNLITEDQSVKEGDIIILTTSQDQEPSVDLSYEIIFKDEYILVINKSGNLPVHPAGKYFFNTLQAKLERDGFGKLDPAHRVDRETSGIVIFAKSKDVLVKLHHAFAKQRINKSYLALTFGIPEPKKGEINKPLLKTTVGELRDFMVCDERGKPAKTEYEVLESSGDFAFVKITLDHGRRHQIRVHLAFIAHPIVGDKLYGRYPELFIRSYQNDKNVAKDILQNLLSERQLLHAYQIELLHPISKEILSFNAKLPNDFSSFLEKNSFHTVFQ